jgi:hypothetical protein
VAYFSLTYYSPEEPDKTKEKAKLMSLGFRSCSFIFSFRTGTHAPDTKCPESYCYTNLLSKINVSLPSVN